MKRLRYSALVLILVTSVVAFSQPASVRLSLENDVIKISSPTYEIDFSSVNGAIVSILDAATRQTISEGTRDANLWTAKFDDDRQIASGAYDGTFSYVLDEAQRQLTLTYAGGTVDVTVTVDAADDQALKMQAAVTNHSGKNIRTFGFPSELQVAADIQDALLPAMPGALLSADFFSKGRTYNAEYPGDLFADYLSIRSTRGRIALYSQIGAILQPAFLGYDHATSAPDETGITHNYRTWIADGTDWSTPRLVVRVGQDYPQTIAAYRTDNGIDQYPSLTDKLGDSAAAYFASPMYKLDVQVLRLTFADLQSAVIDRLNFPGIIHLVAFQKNGHDRSYPDFIPPDPKWGTTDDFASLVSAIHREGSLAVPYTNFSWWDNRGPALSNLPADLSLADVIVKDAHGIPDFETYGPHSGFVVDPNTPFVQNKTSEQFDALLNTVGMDGIFEDQWGARPAPYDFNPSGLATYDPATAYFEGVLDHYRAHADAHLFTEVGVDVLADDAVGFMGTNYLWDMLGYRGATAADTTYYPMAAMLFRDKVLLYQHNLAAQTWTNNQDMLRWNLAQGYNLSNAFLDDALGALNMDNPWLNLIGVFQKYALAHYADQLVVSYDDLGGGLWRTVFPTYQVYSNWSADSPYTVSGNTLPPGGVVTQANDGSVTAGVFTRYNDHDLSDGDHYFVEVRSAAEVKFFQPIGSDTTISVKVPDGAAVTVEARQYDDTLIGQVAASAAEGEVSFDYNGVIDGHAVGYYRIVWTA